MNCPVCNKASLVESQPEPGLYSHRCSDCSGHWITPLEYERWLSTKPVNGSNQAPIELSSKEQAGAKFCPNTGHAMIKYKVSSDLDFSLNRCGNCGGIWFDGNEWEILKSRDLHGNVQRVFTEQWQTQLRKEESERALEKIWTEQIGAEDMAEAKRIKSWLMNHPKSPQLFAYLMSGVNQRK